jgi:hypothetical protein
MKPKKSLSLIVILSFLFITNLVMFSIIQRPLYAEECFYQECESGPFCYTRVWRWCENACSISNEYCEEIEVMEAYCVPLYWECRCLSVWNVICSEGTEYITECHELDPKNCPDPY